MRTLFKVLKFVVVSLALVTAVAGDYGPLRVVIINPFFLPWLQTTPTLRLTTRIY